MADDDAFGEETNPPSVGKGVPCIDGAAVNQVVEGHGTVAALLTAPDGYKLKDVPPKPEPGVDPAIMAAIDAAQDEAVACARKLPKVVEIVIPRIDPANHEAALVEITDYPAMPMGAMVQVGENQWLDVYSDHVEGLTMELCHDKLKLYVDSDLHAEQVLRVVVYPV